LTFKCFERAQKCGYFLKFLWFVQIKLLVGAVWPDIPVFQELRNVCTLWVFVRLSLWFHFQDSGKDSAGGRKPGGKNPDFHIARCLMTTHVLAIGVIALRSRRYRSLLPAGDYSNCSYLTAQQSPDGQTIYQGAAAARRKPRLMLRTPGSASVGMTVRFLFQETVVCFRAAENIPPIFIIYVSHSDEGGNSLS
jgi:hypothetical protein